MKTHIKSAIIIAIGVLICFSASAKVVMPRIFSDDMVVQRDMALKFWGTAKVGSTVRIDFGGVSTSVLVREGGKWSAYMPMQPASKTPRTITVYEDGQKQFEFKNVLVGDVWVAGGQSNMQFTMNAIGKSKDMSQMADLPNVRYFMQPSEPIAEKPLDDTPKNSAWKVCTPESAKQFSAVAFYFAKNLEKSLDVPIGIIYTAMGATQVACWIPERHYADDEVTKKVWEDFKKAKAAYTPEAHKKKVEAYEARIAKFNEESAKAKAEGKPAPKVPWYMRIAPLPISPYLSTSTPFYHFNAKVAPVSGYTAKGVIWYQGESNTGVPLNENYEKQFANMVNCWREAWELPLPFIQVQLASYAANKNMDWPKIRWAQYLATKEIPSVYMVNIIDTGEENNIHPADKEIVGTRLANMALREIYSNREVHALYPFPINFKYRGDTATIRMNANGKKLEGKGEPRGFEVLVGGEWKPATVELRGVMLKVKSSDGAAVEGVRYLWKNWARPDAWLFDDAGHPSISFIDTRKK